MIELFKHNFAVVSVPNISDIPAILESSGIEAFKVDMIDDLEGLIVYEDTNIYINHRLSNRDYNKLLKITEEIHPKLHLVLFTTDLDIPYTLKARADIVTPFRALKSEGLNPFNFSEEDAITIENKSIDIADYTNKAKLLINNLTSIALGNIIKLVKEVEPKIFIKILEKEYGGMFDIYKLRRAIEDITYYHIDGKLVLTILLEDLQRCERERTK